MDLFVEDRHVNFQELTIESSFENVSNALHFTEIDTYEKLNTRLKIGNQVQVVFNNTTLFFTIESIKIAIDDRTDGFIVAIVQCYDSAVVLMQTVASKTIQFTEGSQLSTVFKTAFKIDIDTKEAVGISEDFIIKQGDNANNAINLLTLDKDYYIDTDGTSIVFNEIDGSKGHISIDHTESLIVYKNKTLNILPFYIGDFSKAFQMESKANQKVYNFSKFLPYLYKNVNTVSRVLSNRKNRTKTYTEIELIGNEEWISVNSSMDVSNVGIINHVVWYSKLYVAEDRYQTIIKVAK